MGGGQRELGLGRLPELAGDQRLGDGLSLATPSIEPLKQLATREGEWTVTAQEIDIGKTITEARSKYSNRLRKESRCITLKSGKSAHKCIQQLKTMQMLI